jgi:membrane protease YdiL (CAAX protease family)
MGLMLTGNREVALQLDACSFGLLGLLLPILWIRRRYGLGAEALGLRRGKLRPLLSVGLGVGLAIAYHLGVRHVVFGSPISLPAPRSALAGLFALLSLNGVASIVLGPLSEEVMYRGYLYTYLRGMLGKYSAILLQAALFSGLHLLTWHYGALPRALDVFLLGLLFGVLYDRTKSLTASMACHGTINCLYLAMFSGAP